MGYQGKETEQLTEAGIPEKSPRHLPSMLELLHKIIKQHPAEFKSQRVLIKVHI